MKSQSIQFRPIKFDNPMNSPYHISVSDYSTESMGHCIAVYRDGASIHLHTVSLDDLRKVAFLISSYVEDVERSKEAYKEGLTPRMEEDTTADVQNAREAEYLENK